jgi:hypothetical protein
MVAEKGAGTHLSIVAACEGGYGLFGVVTMAGNTV